MSFECLFNKLHTTNKTETFHKNCVTDRLIIIIILCYLNEKKIQVTHAIKQFSVI